MLERPNRFTLARLGLTVVLGLASPVHAVDSVIEINQSRAMAGGITPGDGPGFPVTIDQPGSYRLTSDLTGESGRNGIDIFGIDDVTLDLNGFAVRGLAGGSIGISISSGVPQNMVVRNGVVRDWSSHGVSAPTVTNSRFEELRISDNGGDKIQVGGQNAIVAVEALNNGAEGITTNEATQITNSVASGNGANGIKSAQGSTILASTTSDNQSHGVFVDGTVPAVATSGCTISDSTAYNNVVDGFNLEAECTVRGNSATRNGRGGFRLASGNLMVDNVARRNRCDLDGDGVNDNTTTHPGCLRVTATA